MSKEEISLLLYLESRCVDYQGILDVTRMNAADWEIIKEWKEKNFIICNRRPMKDIHVTGQTHYVILSEEAWQEAQKQRRERADKNQQYTREEVITT